MPGFGVDQAWLSARYQALPLKPDLLVVGLIDIDFERSQVAFRRNEGFGKPTFRLINGRLMQRGTEAPPNFLMQYLDERSRLWSMGVRAWRAAGVKYGAGEYWSLNQASSTQSATIAEKPASPCSFCIFRSKACSHSQLYGITCGKLGPRMSISLSSIRRRRVVSTCGTIAT